MDSIFTENKPHNWGIRWTEDEDMRLLHGIEQFGVNDWKQVSEFVGTRDAVKCVQRWDKVLRPDLVKGKWTDDEDQQLRMVVMQGYEHWGKVSEKLPGRTAKQCKERWVNYLDPTLFKGPFSHAEDEILIQLQNNLGNKWAAISRQLPGRTENAVKLRFKVLSKVCKGNSNTAGTSTDTRRIYSNCASNNESKISVENTYLQENHRPLESYGEYFTAFPLSVSLEAQQPQKRARLSALPSLDPSIQNITTVGTTNYPEFAVELPTKSVHSSLPLLKDLSGVLLCKDSREGVAASPSGQSSHCSESSEDNCENKPATIAADIPS